MISRALFITVIVLLIGVLGLGVYAMHLKHQIEQTTQTAAEAKPVTAPVNGTSATIAIYVPDDSDGTLTREDITVVLPSDPAGRAREILRTLNTECQKKDSTHPLPSDADIKEVFFPSPNLAVVNSNAAFAEGHPSGILVEELTLAAIARTLAVNMPDVKQFKLLVDGKERDTLAGHIDLMQIYSTDQQTWAQAVGR